MAAVLDRGRERKVENELYRIIKNILESQDYVIGGLGFKDIEPDVRVDGRRADLVLYTSTRRPALVIETKRKIGKGATSSVLRQFDPLGTKVIDQALNYAVKLGSPLFATTNGRRLAIFEVPEKGRPFRLDTNRVLVTEIQLKEEPIRKALEVVARAYLGEPFVRTALDWTFIIRLRSFVEYLSEMLRPRVHQKLSEEDFSEKFKKLQIQVGRVDEDSFTRATAYILMNQIVFYKVLERSEFSLPRLSAIRAPDGQMFHDILRGFFGKATEITDDFEPVFLTGLYDEVPLPDLEWVLEEVNAFIEDMDMYRLEEVGADVVGFIYETLIPDYERHRLGQFNTPPQIAELITKWAIRKADDKVLDPAVGSGTFAVKAYAQLKSKGKGRRSRTHRELLSQVYSVDLDPFPAHLTAMNLAMRDISHPTADMNIIVHDFFRLQPDQMVVTPFMMKTPEGEIRRKLKVPMVDAVVANPPYTRWTEISPETRAAIEKVIGKKLKEYGLRQKGGVRASQSPGIYVHFIVHAAQFLRGDNGGSNRERGRLGMIVSNDWLQTEYGTRLGKYLLDNFAVKAVIDFSGRVFELPLVATNVILLEKCESENERDDNTVFFTYVDRQVSVDHLLHSIREPEESRTGLRITTLRQGDIPRDMRWTPHLFGASKVLKILGSSDQTAPLKDIFEPVKGNITWTLQRSAGLGAKKFFYLTPKEVRRRGLMSCVHPAIPGARKANQFIFGESDWRALEKADKPCYLFLCHKDRSSLTEQEREYVRWGETECTTTDKEKRIKICSEGSAAQERRNRKDLYFDWYDLGSREIEPPFIFAIHNSWSKHRFMLAEFPLCLDHGFIVLRPKDGVKLTKEQLKALAAFFNSNFIQLFAEAFGRGRGAGALSLDLRPFDRLSVPDVRRLPKSDVQRLASLFDRLDAESRKIGDISKSENVSKLKPVFDEIDDAVSEVLELPSEELEDMYSVIELLMKRRKERSGEGTPIRLTGMDRTRITRPKPSKKRKVAVPLKKLDEFEVIEFEDE